MKIRNMNDEIEFEPSVYGTRAIIKSPWKDSYLEILLSKEIIELELNLGKGWRRGNDESLKFLEFLPQLQGLLVLDLGADLIESIHYLKKLRLLNLTTYCKTKINFNEFPNLEDCFIEWRKGCESLFECKTLRKLGINRYDGKNSNVLSKLSNIERMSIFNSRFLDLTGLSALINLKNLRITNLRNITSLEGIESLQNLEDLMIQSCKNIHSVSEVFNLTKLKRFLLLDCGEIDTIKGIENLTELSDFLFYESTNILDGDLTPILKLKNLSVISYQNRKHYTHKREDFGNLYFQNAN